MNKVVMAWAILHMSDVDQERKDTYLIVRPRWERLVRWPLATWRCWRVLYGQEPIWRIAWVCLRVALAKVEE